MRLFFVLLLSSIVSACANFGRKDSHTTDSNIIKTRSSEFLQCTAQTSLLGGKSFDLEVMIEADGIVSRAEVKKNPLDDKFADCVQKKALGWTFLPGDRGVVNTTISFSSEQAQPYSTSDLESVIQAHWNDVESCNKKFGAKMSGEITLQWKITSKGIPAETFMKKRTFLNIKLETCLIEELEEWSFTPHPSGTDSIVTYTFKFPLSNSGKKQ